MTSTETGTIVVDSIAKILAGAGEGVDDQLGAAPWLATVLADGGWTTLTAAGSDADLTLRDLQEVARVCGRSLVPQALITTLLAGRWFELDESALAQGATFPVPDVGGATLPCAVGDTVQVVDGTGRVIGDLGPGGVDTFAAVLPLGRAPTSAAPVGPGQLSELWAVLAATATGCADAVIDRSVDWVQTRHQFGRPLAAFQAVRHHLADMHIAREEAWTCAVAAGAEPADAARWAWTAVQRGKSAVETGIQVHGGIGITWEAGVHQWLRHLLVLESLIADAGSIRRG